jgi:hypothetical protein
MSTLRRPRTWALVRLKIAAMASLVARFWAFEAGRRSERFARPTGPGPLLARIIEKKYGILVTWKDREYPVRTRHGQIGATNAEPPEVDPYSAVLAEFLVYPPDLIRRSRLRRIILCRSLSFAGQDRSALTDYDHDELYLDVVKGEYNRFYQREVIHHEFFHIIDYQDDGQVYSDDHWARLNPESVRYGDGGTKIQDNPLSGLPTDIPGFLSSYAMSGVEEDKAELFAHMMTEYAVVSKRAATDNVLREKVSALKALLARFCPEMDDTFWNGVGLQQSLTR